MTRKIKWPTPEEVAKLKIRTHDEFGQMQPLWFLEDLERLQGIKQPRKPKLLPIVPLSDEELRPALPSLREKPGGKENRKEGGHREEAAQEGLTFKSRCPRSVAGRWEGAVGWAVARPAPARL